MSAPPAKPPVETPDKDPRNLHDMAVDAQTDIQKLATGLAHAGANPQVVSQLTNMGEILSQVAKVLNQSPDVESAAKTGQPPPGATGAPPGAPPQGAPSGPQPGAQAGPPGAPQGPPGMPPGAPGGTTIHSATIALHHDMQQSAARR